MGLLDNLKAKLGPAKDKVTDFAQQHEDKVGQGIEKAAKMVDEKTKGKYSDKIHTGSDKAKQAMGRIAHPDTGTTPGGPPSDTSPPPGM
ncbi:antitoxin [Streptomyces sp. NPDC052051]|uniref:Antitoxin n=1 Tax=Streptomyces macrolidinus TaxID=2952607 RepID=A0ABT0ZG39_9ACTN|nr:antitoxin [Streptomyces macrolidinus]MCN9242531.1 antitoxin [Streptomyces macrolidinus]